MRLQQQINGNKNPNYEIYTKHFAPTPPKNTLLKNVAQMLSVDISSVHNYCKRKILSPKGIGGRVLFPTFRS
jgi:hypothetical protein